MRVDQELKSSRRYSSFSAGRRIGGYGIELQPQEFELGGRPEDFEWLEVQTKLRSEGECPFEGLLHNGRGDVRTEYFQEIIEVMPNASWKMALKNPVQGLCKQIENIGSGATAEAKDKIMVELIFPGETEEVPILASDGDVAEGGL